MNENVLKGSLVYKGETGLSAYELAVQQGFEGTLQDWLATFSDTTKLFSQYKKEYTTTETTTDFAVPSQYVTGSFVDVYVDGLHQIADDTSTTPTTENDYAVVTENDSTLVRFHTGVETDKTVEIVVTIIATNTTLPITETVTSTSTNETAAGTKSVYDFVEDKKATSISSTSGDDKFATPKAVYDKCESLKEEIPKLTSIVDLIYPIGSVYINTTSVNPSTIFENTGWEQIKGRFLIGVGENEANTSTYWGSLNAGVVNCPEGEKGGTTSHNHTTAGHALTVNEMPRHTHTITDSEALYKVENRFGSGSRNAVGAYHGYGSKINFTASQTGGSASHSHGNTGNKNLLPPFLAVYMWKRVA